VLLTPGPTTIMEALEYGLRGICVPRELARDEHVDNNQVDVARYFASEGKIELPDGRDELFALLDKAIENPSTYRAWRNLAGIRVREGELNAAIEAYRADLGPDRVATCPSASTSTSSWVPSGFRLVRLFGGGWLPPSGRSRRSAQACRSPS
jgi:hypothetical protein